VGWPPRSPAMKSTAPGSSTATCWNAEAALKAADACGSPRMAEWPLMAKGFVELSQGRHEAALTTLQPLVARLGVIPGIEIMSGWHLPNAAEAMVALDRLDDAEPLIEALERNGAAHDRPWMLAAGARCRAMWPAAKGDVEGALEMANRAMAEHDRTPMRFECARTRLLLGKLQRRRRAKEVAANTLSEALAASGMTNRDIAATLFITIKTVEHNLSRVYAKLGIRSRAELGRRMDQLAGTE
jgi:Bacterial regulatory proteins, luxR family